jgi:hypothetical protein
VSAVVLYPCALRVTGHPAQHGLADLTLTVDTNDVHETRVVITTDQLVDLHEQISRKLAEIPFNLVSGP